MMWFSFFFGFLCVVAGVEFVVIVVLGVILREYTRALADLMEKLQGVARMLSIHRANLKNLGVPDCVPDAGKSEMPSNSVGGGA